MTNLSKGLASVVAFQGTFAVVQLLQVPILLSAWGPDKYGQWLLLQIAQMIAARSDLGLAVAGSKEMTIRLKRGNDAQAVNLFHNVLTCVLSLQFLTMLAVMAFTSLTGTSWGIEMGADDILITIFWMTLAGFIMSQMETLYGVFYAIGRQPVAMMIRTMGQWAWLGALAIAVLSGAGIPEAAMAACLGLSLQVLVSLFILMRGQSPFTLRLKMRLGDLKALIMPSLSMASLPAAQIISLAVPRLIIAATGGAVMVAVFNAHRQLTRSVMLVYGLALAFEPFMTQAKADEDRASFLKSAVACQVLVIALAILASIALTIIASFIFEVWTGNQVEWLFGLFSALLLVAILEATWRSFLAALTAANEHTAVGSAYLFLNVIVLGGVAAATSWSLASLPILAAALLAIEFIVLLLIVREFAKKNVVSTKEWWLTALSVTASFARSLKQAMPK